MIPFSIFITSSNGNGFLSGIVFKTANVSDLTFGCLSIQSINAGTTPCFISDEQSNKIAIFLTVSSLQR